MDNITKLYETFKEESKTKVLDDQECQFVSNVLNSNSRVNNRNCDYISVEEVVKHSNKVYNLYNS